MLVEDWISPNVGANLTREAESYRYRGLGTLGGNHESAQHYDGLSARIHWAIFGPMHAPIRALPFPVRLTLALAGDTIIPNPFRWEEPMSRISRRRFVEGTGAGLAAVAAVPLAVEELAAQQKSSPAGATSGALPGVPRTTVKLTVNGAEHSVEVEDRWTLVEVLRDHLQLIGTRIGCDRSECGACTVLIDGKPMYACTQLAAWMDGRSVQTVEGLAKGANLDPLQEAFIKHDAPQCGFCTSGQLMAAKALLNHNPHPTRDEVRAAMTGNLCRCSNYNHYVEAVLAASGGQA